MLDDVHFCFGTKTFLGRVLVKVEMLWKLKCGDLLTCGDLSLAFFGLVLYITRKFHCLIPGGQKVSLLQVFNLRVEIAA